MPRALSWTDQERRLTDRTGLVGEAVAAQLAVGDVAGAVELAELGRGVLLSHQLDIRGDVPELAAAAPDLAREFERVRRELADPAGAGRSHRAITKDWDAVLTRIHAVPGFEEFLARPRLADLCRAAVGGTVILVNTGWLTSDAVLLSGTGVTRVHLPDLTQRDVDRYAGAVGGAGVTAEMLAWLWTTVVAPILDALGTGDTPRRVWWVLTGLLGLLPVHAAGLPGGPSALDHVISSYAPTIRTLLAGQRRRAPDTESRLTVAMRHTPGGVDLPATVAEAEALRRTRPDTVSLVDPTAAGVLAALRTATTVHFACHAVTRLARPSDSGLLLRDSVLSVPEISRLRLDRAELAYLSACSTAVTGATHADEAMHLASAFQLAGFRHVIATLSPVDDGVAAVAAGRFYRYLADDGADSAPFALHRLTRDLRDLFPAQPELWASFIHSGP